ncbi:MAG: hypothetical protein JSU74_11695 [Candidatus Zixiibacteriota bacterium]|nr:MAG: hypothetical protein JSU74_11695 [candidate division Zixibacteria bacterium]
MKTLPLAMMISLLLMIMVGAAFGGPNLTIPESAFDFGYVPQHSKVSHIFWLHSTGDSTLQITKIVPG